MLTANLLGESFVHESVVFRGECFKITTQHVNNSLALALLG